MGLSIVRPFVRELWKLPGLAVCPFLALCVVVGIFPAYGFRPECILLLLFALFLFCANLPDFYALFFGLHGDTYRDKGPVFTIVTAVVFVFVMGITVSFSPSTDGDLSTGGVQTVFLDRGKLHVRIYGEIKQEEAAADDTGETQDQEESRVVMILADEAAGAEAAPMELPPGRPLLILAPPVAGSFTVSDEVCAALRDRGFTVLCFSRVNFDSPFFEENGKPVRLSASGLFRLVSALTRGTKNTAANARGRELEEGRKNDILFLLEEISVNKTLRDLLGDTDTNTVYLAGYGAGGAALTTLAGTNTFAAQFPQVRGIAAIEAPILSSLESDPMPPPPPPATNPFSALFRAASLAIKNNSARKITHISNIPRTRLPCLFVVADRVTQRRTGRYETILKALEQSHGPSLLAAVPGSGPFDYSASPGYYPMFSALFRGAQQPGQKRDWPDLTAAIITNFAVLVEENAAAGMSAAATNSGETIAAGANTGSVPGGAVPGNETLVAETQPAVTEAAETQPESSSLKTRLVTSVLDPNLYLEQGGVWHIPGALTILEP
jgi:hypothetical protein